MSEGAPLFSMLQVKTKPQVLAEPRTLNPQCAFMPTEVARYRGCHIGLEVDQVS